MKREREKGGEGKFKEDRRGEDEQGRVTKG